MKSFNINYFQLWILSAQLFENKNTNVYSIPIENNINSSLLIQNNSSTFEYVNASVYSNLKVNNNTIEENILNAIAIGEKKYQPKIREKRGVIDGLTDMFANVVSQTVDLVDAQTRAENNKQLLKLEKKLKKRKIKYGKFRIEQEKRELEWEELTGPKFKKAFKEKQHYAEEEEKLFKKFKDAEKKLKDFKEALEIERDKKIKESTDKEREQWKKESELLREKVARSEADQIELEKTINELEEKWSELRANILKSQLEEERKLLDSLAKLDKDIKAYDEYFKNRKKELEELQDIRLKKEGIAEAERQEKLSRKNAEKQLNKAMKTKKKWDKENKIKNTNLGLEETNAEENQFSKIEDQLIEIGVFESQKQELIQKLIELKENKVSETEIKNVAKKIDDMNKYLEPIIEEIKKDFAKIETIKQAKINEEIDEVNKAAKIDLTRRKIHDAEKKYKQTENKFNKATNEEKLARSNLTDELLKQAGVHDKPEIIKAHVDAALSKIDEAEKNLLQAKLEFNEASEAFRQAKEELAKLESNTGASSDGMNDYYNEHSNLKQPSEQTEISKKTEPHEEKSGISKQIPQIECCIEKRKKRSLELSKCVPCPTNIEEKVPSIFKDKIKDLIVKGEHGNIKIKIFKPAIKVIEHSVTVLEHSVTVFFYGSIVIDYMDSSKNITAERLGGTLGNIIGWEVGAAEGAGAGTAACAPIFPPLGSLVCGFAGGIIGGFAGSEMGENIGSKVGEVLDYAPKKWEQFTNAWDKRIKQAINEINISNSDIKKMNKTEQVKTIEKKSKAGMAIAATEGVKMAFAWAF